MVTFIEELRIDPMNPRFHSICKMMILDLAIAVYNYMGQGAKTRQETEWEHETDPISARSASLHDL